jgi:mRNA interferase RelE/StbE
VAEYKIGLRKSAAAEIDALPTKKDRQRIVARIQTLASNPRPQGSEKLAGEQDRYRLRQGRYRILYSIGDAVLTVIVVRVAHRKETYR